jgi:hypothetical protein
LSLAFYSQHIIKHCSRSLRREQREIKEKNSIRRQTVHLPISLSRFCTKSPAHATAAAVIMVVGATVAWLPPLHLHHRCRLQPRHTAECWSGPRPLPLTTTPIQGVVREGRVPSTVGTIPVGLHWSMTLHHRAVKGRRREEKKKKTSARSRWSTTLLGRR